MTLDIAAILMVDGVASGAIYVLMGIGLVLIFAVTRVIFVPFGDLSAIAALTLSSLEARQLPGTIGLVTALAVLATLVSGRRVDSRQGISIDRQSARLLSACAARPGHSRLSVRAGPIAGAGPHRTGGRDHLAGRASP